MSSDETLLQGWAGNKLEALPVGSQEPEIWFQRAQKATTLSEALVCLNQVYTLDPQNAQAREMRYQVLWRLLEADPFLAYQGETKHLYRVWSNLNLELIVPKSRAAVESYPPAASEPLTPAFSWLRWTVVGLLPAGLGALLLAPATAVRTLIIFYKTPLNQADQVRVFVILFWAIILWAVAISLAFLFMLHLV